MAAATSLLKQFPTHLLCFLTLVCCCANSGDAQTKDGMFISVPTIREEVVDQVERKIEAALKALKKKALKKKALKKKALKKKALKNERSIFTVVFDFNHFGPNSSRHFGSCHDLAALIRNLRKPDGKGKIAIDTYAYVHGEISRHTVLPVVACKKIIMSDAKRPQSNEYVASIGNVLKPGQRLLGSERGAYDGFAKGFASPDLVRMMYTPGLVVREVQDENTLTKYYLSDATIQARKDEGQSLTITDKVPAGLEAGATKLDPEKAKKYGLARALRNSRDSVRRALGLSQKSMVEDWLIGRTVVPWRIEIRGKIDGSSLSSLKRRIERARGQGANFIILHLACEGGETEGGPSFAKYLSQLKDSNNVHHIKTVAYIPPNRKLGPGTFLALGCDEIVMADSAVLGDFNYLYNQKDIDTKVIWSNLVRLAKERGFEPLLFRAMLDRGLKLYRVKARLNADQYTVVTDEQWNKDQNSKNPQWHGAQLLSRPNGKFLSLDARMAREWQIATYTDVNTIADLYDQYNLDAERVSVSSDDWLDKVAAFFRHPVVVIVLLIVGFAGLMLELKMPGIGFPGILGAICFVLFFWASSFVGEFTVLAVLLFILGLILIGVEVFVIPGFGITGISGLLLVLTSLVLVTMERIPQSSGDWVQLGGTIITFGGSVVAAVILAMLVAWYLPSIPYFNRIVLAPPTQEGEFDNPEPTEAEEKAAALLGAIGVAATTLRPAGKVQFGDEYLDVVAEGDYITPGKRVQVIEIEGNRVVVKEV